MHTLSRQIRFTVDPFAADQVEGFNSYASRPTGDGLGIYLALWVDLESPLNPDTGFVINVSEIDKYIRLKAIPKITQFIQAFFANRKTPTLWEMAALLGNCRRPIEAGFPDKKLKQLRLELNPFRQIILQSEAADMFTYSEKFEFAAMHRLWNAQFDEKTNFDLFGKCANAAGHGHNYVLEVHVQCGIADVEAGWVSDYQQVVKKQFLDLVDHKNLNVDVAGFERLNPTVENLAFFAWEKLEGAFAACKLVKIIVWENDRTFCSYTRQ